MRFVGPGRRMWRFAWTSHGSVPWEACAFLNHAGVREDTAVPAKLQPLARGSLLQLVDLKLLSDLGPAVSVSQWSRGLTCVSQLWFLMMMMMS